MDFTRLNPVVRRRFAAGLVGALLSTLFITSNQATPQTLPFFISAPAGEDSAWNIINEQGIQGSPTGDYCSNRPGLSVEDGRIGNRTDAFDNGATLFVDNTQFSATGTSSTVDRDANDPSDPLDGDTMTTGVQVLSGLRVTMQYHAVDNSATLRTLASLENPSTATVTATVSFRSNSGADQQDIIPAPVAGSVTPTSSGDNAYQASDRWVITGNSVETATAVVTHVLFGPDGPPVVPSSVSRAVFSCPQGNPVPSTGPNQGVRTDFQVPIPAQSTRRLMFFHQLNGSFAQASSDTVGAYDSNLTLGDARLFGINPTHLFQVVNWKFAIDKFFITGPGPGPGPGLVKVISVNPTGQLAGERFGFGAFESTYQGGVTVATGDVDGDGIPEIITGAAGPGRPSQVRVWKLTTDLFGIQPGPYAEFTPYGGYSGGVYVAAGDVNGDGKADIITAPAATVRPHVKVFRIDPVETSPNLRPKFLSEFLAFPEGSNSGARVAAGDLVGDNRFEIVTGAGWGSQGRVGVFGYTNDTIDPSVGTTSSLLIGNSRPGTLEPWDGFFPYTSGYSNGVFVGTGNLVGNAYDEIITGSGNNPNSTVNVYKLSNRATLSRVASFLAYASTFQGGVNVASSDVDSDPGFELVTGPGPGVGPLPRTFAVAENGTVTAQLGFFFAYPASFPGGLWVAGYNLGT